MTRANGISLSVVVAFLVACNPGSQNTTAVEESKTTTETHASKTQGFDSKSYDGPLFPAVRDGKYGFIDINGSFVIPPTFTSALEFSEGLAAVYVGGQSLIDDHYIDSKGGKWGYIDRAGEMKIAPQFGYADIFSEGLARVTLANGLEGGLGEVGYIDVRGLFKIAPQYDYLSSSSFKKGIAHVQLATINASPEFKTGVEYFDSSGKRISVATAVSMMNERVRLRKGHWINTSGEKIDDTKALSILGVDRIKFEKRNTVKIHGRTFEVIQYGFRDNKGKEVVKAKFDSVGTFYDKKSFKAYKYSTACTASSWETFGNDVAILETEKCGLIDESGGVVAPFDFDHIRMVSDDLAVFNIGCNGKLLCGAAGKMGIFSVKERKIVVNPRFDRLYHGDDVDLIRVEIDGRIGFINASGNYVIEPKFSVASTFVNGVAIVDFPPSYIDKTGKYLYKGSIGTLQPKPKEPPASAPVGGTESASGTPKKSHAGTAFVVSRDGHAVTNFHVVDGCTELRAEGREGPIKRVTDDTINDLALVKIPGEMPSSATIVADPAKLRQGEDIVVFGFPLNAVLSSGGNLTPGVVSALTGLGNNTNQIQITAPIQPGSSGSPVINKKGEVVGVVSMKLSDSKMARATGQIGQNVNFAIGGQTLKAFLNTHKIDFRSGRGFLSFDKSTADLADEARKWTLVLECWK